MRTAAAALIAVVALAVPGCGGGAPGTGTTHATAAPRTTTRSSFSRYGGATQSRVAPAATTASACRARAIELSLADGGQETGERGGDFVLKNRASAPCAVKGYPNVELSTHGSRLPFRYQDGGGPYVTKQRPKRVLVPAGASAYFVVAKYRCDVGELSAPATTLDVKLPSDSRSLTLSLDHGYGDLEYCRSAHGPTSDYVGNTVVTSPVTAATESTLP